MDKLQPTNDFLKSYTCEELKKISLDEFIVFMMKSGKYDVNIETGEVFGPMGKLAKTYNTQGYIVAVLCFNRKICRQVKVHRMIVLKIYGITECNGKQVAHLDGTRDNNNWKNLKLMTAKEHIYYDGTHKNLIKFQKGTRKTKWDKCASCGDPDGEIGVYTPKRITGARFGINGSICKHCYYKFQERERRLKRKKNKNTN